MTIPNTVSVECSTVQYHHWLEYHEGRQQRLLQQRHSWATVLKGRLSDCEILQEPREITAGKRQMEGDDKCVIIAGAINDKLE